MADLAKIFAGMDKGPEVIDQNFGILNSYVEGKITVHDWSSDGLVDVNGFHTQGEPTAYRYVELANQTRIVELFLNVFGAFKSGDQQVLTLPDKIALTNAHWQYFLGWGDGRIDGNNVIFSATTSTSDSNAHCITATVVYIAK